MQDELIFKILKNLHIDYEVFEHPPTPTIEDALAYWKDIDATHCKNLFFRNHKGNRHYLVILDCMHDLDIHDLEHRLHQGKLSFASPERMMRYLGVTPGSVSPFGLINDTAHHVTVFLDERLRAVRKISFHPNRNTASVVMSGEDFIKYLDWTQNPYEFINLYNS
ncbi:MAG: prolyl-tRNA synthetase associated domain-containing protein [Bacteroidales bacterium]|nr:prolyl-tRNA synthetase associated domain-containing protein [Bacteroidales bacterium]